MQAVIGILTSSNPHTPLELVFLEPATLPDTEAILSVAKLKRPHFLDINFRYQAAVGSNRAILFTVVSSNARRRFSGQMKRQIYWWKHSRLPCLEDLEALWHLDGVLIDTGGSQETLKAWQNRLAACASEIIAVCFADAALQRRWIQWTCPQEFYFGGLFA